jgi:hypothetical protein
MCDYSLETYRTRPAREGERYVTTRFPSGSVGLASPEDCSTAVCIPYDTKLRLENIPEDVQRNLSLGPVEDVTFARIESGPYHDGVRFRTGTEVPLHALRPGVTVTTTNSLDGMALPLKEAVPA